ncbi:hypothetical protein OK074_3644 [Actinobacteria bacterium OK074]|nr:hypothetical protein OK074_3644 [Actinobacteria bacterium OK074]
MVAFRVRSPKVWLWRWRRNPLRRPSDRLEAWVVLVAWAVTVVGGVLAGIAATHSVAHGLAQERAEWRPVTARLTEAAPQPSSTSGSGSASGERVWAPVRWTGADGSVHTGQARVALGSSKGSPVTVWTDRHGLLVTKPATRSEAEVRATMVGILAGVAAAAVPFAGGRLARGRLERRRLDQWDAAWARFGPTWGRKPG